MIGNRITARWFSRSDHDRFRSCISACATSHNTVTRSPNLSSSHNARFPESLRVACTPVLGVDLASDIYIYYFEGPRSLPCDHSVSLLNTARHHVATMSSLQYLTSPADFSSRRVAIQSSPFNLPSPPLPFHPSTFHIPGFDSHPLSRHSSRSSAPTPALQ